MNKKRKKKESKKIENENKCGVCNKKDDSERNVSQYFTYFYTIINRYQRTYMCYQV